MSLTEALFPYPSEAGPRPSEAGPAPGIIIVLLSVPNSFGADRP